MRVMWIGIAAIVAAMLIIPKTAAAQNSQSPFFADDLKPGERWFTRDHGGGTQDLGHDLTIRRYTGGGAWTCNAANTDGSKNHHKPAWNKPFYAIEDGVVERCWRNAPENAAPGIKDPRIGPGPDGVPSGGNHLLVRTDDGALMLYAHARKGTISRDLCPTDDELLNAGQDKGFTIPTADRPRIRRGQLLGRVGNSGESSGPHLHVHKVDGSTPIAIPMARGLVSEFTESGSGDCNGDADINSWTTLSGSPIPQDRVLFWPPRRLHGQYTRSKFPAGDFGRMFDHLADSGYQLSWIDGYSVGGKIFFNYVWDRASGPWRAYYGLKRPEVKTKLNRSKAAGFEPVHLESYLDNGQIRYALIFRKNVPGTWLLRTHRTPSQHQVIFDTATSDGLKPASISVVSAGGQLRYSVLYRSGSIGSWQAKSMIAESDYQSVFAGNSAAGRRPIYLNAYMHGGRPFVSAIFASQPQSAARARHGMSPAQLQDEFDVAMQQGFATKIITSFDGANSLHRYFAIWRK